MVKAILMVVQSHSVTGRWALWKESYIISMNDLNPVTVTNWFEEER